MKAKRALTAHCLGVAAGLTELGARVIFASRQPKRAARACGQITQKALAKKGGGACVAATVDLADPASVYEFADGLVDKGQPLAAVCQQHQ